MEFISRLLAPHLRDGARGVSRDDRGDIALLARRGLINPVQLRKRAEQAVAGNVGDLDRLKNSIDIACRIAGDTVRRER